MPIVLPDAEYFFLVMCRNLAALAMLPVFGHSSVPAMAKLALAACITWLLVTPQTVVPPHAPGLLPFLLEVGVEVLIGLLLGFVASLAFWAVGSAGDLVGLQMGFNFGGTVHHSLDNPANGLNTFYTIIATLIFLGAGAHRTVLYALSQTLVTAPPYAVVLGDAQYLRAIQMITQLFAHALQIAMPIVGTLLLVEVTLGFLSRVLPQMNVFVLGMPLKIGVGVFVLWISLPGLVLFLERWLTRGVLNMQSVLR